MRSDCSLSLLSSVPPTGLVSDSWTSASAPPLGAWLQGPGFPVDFSSGASLQTHFGGWICLTASQIASLVTPGAAFQTFTSPTPVTPVGGLSPIIHGLPLTPGPDLAATLIGSDT